MRILATAFVVTTFVACEPVHVHECVSGRAGIEVAAAYAAEYWPDVVDSATDLLVSCKPQDLIESSSCLFSRVERPEACSLRGGPGSRARIAVSHDEDAAIVVCHELQHLRDAVWFAGDGCQSHSIDCGYDVDAVERCEQAVHDFRGGA